jgi:hypothetical protein
VSWQQVYGRWREKGWRTDACLMFESIPRDGWKDLAKDAKAYGRAVAKSFGPSSPTPLLESVEVGNEPGKWSDADYATILKAMAEGIREGDPKLKIATCNLTTGKSGGYEKSVACLDGLLPLVDVLNVHSYAQLEGWPTWKRSFPEDPALKNYLPDIEKLCAWRDAYGPGKAVWLTEYGYDSSTKPAPKEGDFSKWEGVDDVRQAQWLVRSALVFSAMPVDRAYVYFFDDKDEPQVHGSSGLTRNFQPKPSFHAMAQLQRVLGECRFKRMVRNDAGECRIQEYAGEDGRTEWAVWSPTGSGRMVKMEIGDLPGGKIQTEEMTLTGKVKSEMLMANGGKVEVQVGEGPVYLVFGGR